ncbi:uncharacterized protein LOC111264932 isoform X3 [Varroa jacobsoni]|nr:uncharacterized protein LOC111264932 isoform X3 [Varroa jacobsoni]
MSVLLAYVLLHYVTMQPDGFDDVTFQASATTPVVLQALEMLKGADEVVGRMARLGGLGGGLTILLPIFLCIGFFAFIIPFFAILFLGAGGGQGWGGAAGLYPAGRKVADMFVPGLPLTNEQLVQAMTFLDKAFIEFGSKVLTSSLKPASSAKARGTMKKKSGNIQPKFADNSLQGFDRGQVSPPAHYSTTTSSTSTGGNPNQSKVAGKSL